MIEHTSAPCAKKEKKAFRKKENDFIRQEKQASFIGLEAGRKKKPMALREKRVSPTHPPLKKKKKLEAPACSGAGRLSRM